MALEHHQSMTVDEIILASLGVRFSLADVYVDVEFGDTVIGDIAED